MVIGGLAPKSGLSKPYISQVETGKASPSLQTLETVAQALGVIAHLPLFEDNPDPVDGTRPT
jgi:transcriptional regulator with XRE-family HTH domain